MTLVDRIKEVASAKGFTLASLERELSLGNGTIRKWDTSSPSSDKLKAVAIFLSVSTDFLLFGSYDDMEKSDEILNQFPSDLQFIIDRWSYLSDDLKYIILGKVSEGFLEAKNLDQNVAKSS